MATMTEGSNMEFYLICTLYFSRKSQLGKPNSDRRAFNRFVKRLKLIPKGTFPIKNDKSVCQHLVCTRRLNKQQFVTAGVPHQGQAGGIVDSSLLIVLRPAIPSVSTVHNFLVYENLVLFSDASDSLYLAEITKSKPPVLIKELKICSLIVGGINHNCGRHLDQDGSLVYMSVQKTFDNRNSAEYFLMRLDLKEVNHVNLEQAVKKLNFIEIAKSKQIYNFCLSLSYVYVLDSEGVLRISKKSLVSKRVIDSKASDAASGPMGISCIAANDFYLYGQSGDKLMMFKIDSNNKMKLVTTCERPGFPAVFQATGTRLLTTGFFKGVNFILRAMENQMGVAVYASFGKQLKFVADSHIACNEQETFSNVLGCIYDQETSQIITSQEGNNSRVIKLTF